MIKSDPREIQRRIREHLAFVKCLGKQKLRIIELLPHEVVITSDGLIVRPKHTPESRRMIKQLDEMLEAERRRLFGEEGGIDEILG
jgi:hypothetical protein